MKCILFLFLISFFLLSSVACGFEDTVQRYDVDFEEVWDVSTSGYYSPTVTNINYPILYPSSQSIKLFSYYADAGGADAKIKSIDSIDSDYFAFTMHQVDVNANGVRDNGFKISFYNTTSDALITTISIGSVANSGGVGRYEIVRLGSTFNYELYINGANVKSFSLAYDVEEFKIEFNAHTVKWDSAGGDINLIFDDFSTSSVVGINEEWTEAVTYIDTSYGIQSMASYPVSLFEMKIYKISDNSLINSTTLTTPSGFVRWNRSEIFGTNYGMFKASIERDDVELANALFSHEYSQTGAYTPTIITIYSSTPAEVQDEDSTGGFTNQNGYRYLSPRDNGDKIYPISIVLNYSNSVDIIVSANPEYVNSSPLTISGLSDAKSYHTFIDGEFVTQITGVSSYYYNISSFSTHTFSLIDSANVPVIEIGEGVSSSSGLISVGEITLTKELVDVLTIEQIQEMDIPQDVKDKLIAIKSINVNWWMFILVISLTGLIVEGSHKKGHESIIIISFIGVVISAYKLGYF